MPRADGRVRYSQREGAAAPLMRRHTPRGPWNQNAWGMDPNRQQNAPTRDLGDSGQSYQFWRPSQRYGSFEERAAARRAYEEQQYYGAGGAAGTFQDWEGSGMGGQHWDSFASNKERNAARTKYYMEQLMGIGQGGVDTAIATSDPLQNETATVQGGVTGRVGGDAGAAAGAGGNVMNGLAEAMAAAQGGAATPDTGGKSGFSMDQLRDSPQYADLQGKSGWDNGMSQAPPPPPETTTPPAYGGGYGTGGYRQGGGQIRY